MAVRPRGRRSTTSKAEMDFVSLIDPALGPLREESIWVQLESVRTIYPDLVFQRGQVAVFYDGCYWHECPEHFPDCRHGAVSTKDAEVDQRLADWGWLVIRVWEHEPAGEAAARVNDLIHGHQRMHPDRVVARYYHYEGNIRPRLAHAIHRGVGDRRET